MSKIAGIKGHSPEAYPDTPFSGGIASESAFNAAVVTLSAGAPTSLLGVTPGPITVQVDDGERLIVRFSGCLQDPKSGEDPSNETANLFVYVGEELLFEITVLVSIIGSPLPVNIYWGEEFGTSGPVVVDIRGQTVAGTVQAVASSLIVIVSPR